MCTNAWLIGDGREARMFRSIIAVLVVLAGAATGAYVWMNLRGPGGPPAGMGGPPPNMPSLVEPAAVRIGTAQPQVTAIGTLLSNESVIMRPEVGGRIVRLEIAEGQRVARGQVLMQLDSTIERADVTQAEALLQLARANNARAEELTRSGAGTQRALDEARSGLRVAEATLAARRARLEKLTIEAPFDGMLGMRRVSVGDVINAGAELVNLEMVDPLKVDFRVPELFLPAVRAGQTVALQVDAYPGRNFEGQVMAINPAIDPAGRSIWVRARVPNPDDALRPGLFARVTLTLATRENSAFVPDSAIVPFGDRTFVFKIVEGRAAQTPVRLGERSRGEVEVIEGLAAGDVVVATPLAGIRVRDGVPVCQGPPAQGRAPVEGVPPCRPPGPPAATPQGGRPTAGAAPPAQTPQQAQGQERRGQ
jgi:membrane fusion protein (multidrug efflux system)